MKHLWNKRRLAALGAVAAMVGVTLWVVVPALADPNNAGPYVEGASGNGVVPAEVPIGGNGTCSTLFPGMAGVSEYDNPNPQTTSGFVPSGNVDSSDNPDGARFQLTLTGPNKAQQLQVDSRGAQILGIGINGGTHSTVYDYTGFYFAPAPLLQSDQTYDPTAGPGWVTGDSGLHAPLAKGYTLNGTVEVAGRSAQWYGISHLTVCYQLIPGVPCADIPSAEPSNYQITLDCEQKTNTLFVFDSSPAGAAADQQYVSVWASGTDGPVPMLEKITFDDPISGGTPTYTGLRYDDTFPFSTDLSTLPDMPYCELDPRTSTGSLASPYDTYGAGGSDLVLGGNTSCLISVEITAPAPSSPQSTTGKLVAYVYSTIDGLRTAG